MDASWADNLLPFPVLKRGGVALDAADRHALEHVEELVDQGSTKRGRIAVAFDRHGALTLGASALAGMSVRTYFDERTSSLALAQNAGRVRHHGYEEVDNLPDVLVGAALLLMRVPKSVRLLETALAEAGRQGVEQVVLVGMMKHLSRRTNAISSRYYREITTEDRGSKSRLILGSVPQAASSPPQPRVSVDPETNMLIHHVAGAYGDGKMDEGTRLLLQNLHRLPQDPQTVLDLGCGTGVIACYAAALYPEARIWASDVSRAAVESAQRTAGANGYADRISTLWDDCGSSIPDGSVDLILVNPPFHHGHQVDPSVALRLLASARKKLRARGRLVCVYNSHLKYRKNLRLIFSEVEQVARDPKFTVVSCVV